MRLHIISLIALILAFFAQTVSANTDEREWTFKSGEKIRAAQLRYDTETGEVILLIEDSEEKSVQFEDLSPIDQAWLIEWDQIDKEMDALVKHLGGRFEHYLVEGEEFSTDTYLYYPTICETNNTRPMLILFNASGNAARYL
ncbi:MAG: hypothetical protein JXR40_06255, partial [Pontiellaceae bacterium]|nr:hypothetical protein [Pontiellaceae bacterium]